MGSGLRAAYCARSLPSRGAWIEMGSRCPTCAGVPSLPSRGAWIEIHAGRRKLMPSSVAPLAGSVDRNLGSLKGYCEREGSLPSRGAWIEILLYAAAKPSAPGRSPRGERG